MTGDKNSPLIPVDYSVKGTANRAYHGKCYPALIVRYGIKEIFSDQKPDLPISGIN
ncbi:MAG TPA: hypothetical protein EYH10_02580 [Deltaproteobacteria bacterium]|nr:hypothetical protein [Deltaproteobacteria bacterium]